MDGETMWKVKDTGVDTCFGVVFFLFGVTAYIMGGRRLKAPLT